MRKKYLRELVELISVADNPEEIRPMMGALLTPSEAEEIAKRWQIFKLLIEGKTQREVRDILEVSIATVTRGARETKYGSGVVQKFYNRLYSKDK